MRKKKSVSERVPCVGMRNGASLEANGFIGDGMGVLVCSSGVEGDVVGWDTSNFFDEDSVCAGVTTSFCNPTGLVVFVSGVAEGGSTSALAPC